MPTRRWVSIATALTVAGLGTVFVLVGLEDADQLASTVGAMATVIGLGLTLYLSLGQTPSRRAARPDPPSFAIAQQTNSEVATAGPENEGHDASADRHATLVIHKVQGLQIGKGNIQKNYFLQSPDAVRAAAADSLARRLRRQWEAELQVRGVEHRLDVQLTGYPPPGDEPVWRARTESLDWWTAALQRAGRRRMVISGQPGSGKSTAAALTMLKLLPRVKGTEDGGTADNSPTAPVPVLLNASGWNPDKQRLDEWIKAQLAIDHPALAPRQRRPWRLNPLRHLAGWSRESMATQLVDHELVLPVIDGLNELPAEVWPQVQRRLQETLHNPQREFVLVCASDAVPSIIPPGLPDTLAVEIQPVSTADAMAYLDSTPAITRPGQPPTNRWEAVAARLHAEPDSPAARALSTPLMLSLARAVYGTPDADPAELLDRDRFPDPSTVEEELLARYLRAVYQHRPPQPAWDSSPALSAPEISEAWARRWLGYLARRLDRAHRTSFAWWELTSPLLSNGDRPRRLRTRLPAPTGVPGWVLGLGMALTVAWYAVSSAFLAGWGWVVGHGWAWAMPWLLARTPPSVTSDPRWAEMIRLNEQFTGWLAVGFGDWWGRALVIMAVLAVPMAAWYAVEAPDSDPGTPVSPVEELRADRRLAYVRAAVAAGLTLTAGLIAGPAVQPRLVGWLAEQYPMTAERLPPGWLSGLLLGGLGALMVASGVLASSTWGGVRMYTAGQAVLLRLPRRTLEFLDDAHRRGVLRRNGTRYEFRHLLLQRHLAVGRHRATVGATLTRARQLHAAGRQREVAKLLRKVWLYSDEALRLLAEVYDAHAAAAARRPVWYLPVWLRRVRAAILWWHRAAERGDPAAEAGLDAIYHREALHDHGWGTAGQIKCLVFHRRAVARLRPNAAPDRLLALMTAQAYRGGDGLIDRYLRYDGIDRAARVLRPRARTDRPYRRALIALLTRGGRTAEARLWALLATDGPVTLPDPLAAAEPGSRMERYARRLIVRLHRWSGEPDKADRIEAAALVGRDGRAPEVSAGVILSATVRAAVDAAVAACPDGRPLSTGTLLDALVRHDPLGAWERVWEHTGDPRQTGLAATTDPDPTVIAPGPAGITTQPLTADLAASLRILHQLVHRYGMSPVQPGALALALVADPGTGAARALLRHGAVPHAMVLDLIARELLHADLPDVSRIVDEVA